MECVRVCRHLGSDTPVSMKHGGVVAPAEAAADGGQRLVGELACDVHGYLTGERDMRRPVVPSGWTPLGMIEHLGHAERFWFKQVITGTADPPGDRPGAEAEAGDGPFATSRPVPEVLAFYGEQAERSDEILAVTPLGSRPAARMPPDMAAF